jgi:hypothetical protein
MKLKRDNIKKSVIIICLLGIIACLLLLIPQIRQIIINLAEQFLVRRGLKDHTKWHKALFWLSINGNILFGLFLFCYLFIGVVRILQFLINPLKLTLNEIQKVPYKKFWGPILCMFGLYVVGIISIIRTDFLYMDDLGRTIDGYRGWNVFSRYISDFLAVFLHADTHINDISPLPQVIAALFIAVASVLFVHTISDGKITKTACFLSLPIGLSPYFLECFSYKFDAPYMALSVLASIVPFLFMRNYVVFSLCSIISLLIMCMTYQAASGIYIIVVILLCFKAWNEREKTGREIIRFTAVSAFSYCISMIVFRLFFMKMYDGYVSTDMYPIHKLFIGAVNNFRYYMSFVNADFGFIWKILVIILCLTFVIVSVLFTKRNKIAALAVSFSALAAMCSMSFGVYLLLARPLFAPRSMYGFGIFIACITIYLSTIPKKMIIIPAVLLCWCFFVFSFTYGNALSEQKRYDNFRTEMLLHDLSMLFPDKTEEPQLIKLINSGGFAPSIQNISIRNPVIHRLVQINVTGEWYWGCYFLTRYYNANLQKDESIEEAGMTVLFDSYYHTIKSNGRDVLVILK